MNKYCSNETRKIIEKLTEYGLETHRDDYYTIEGAIGSFWPTHVIQVIEKIVTPSNLGKIETRGFDYLAKPIYSMLTPRIAAHRTPQILLDPWPEPNRPRAIYDNVTSTFLYADFNMQELDLLCCAIPKMIEGREMFEQAKIACKDNRSIFYLHGVVRREYQTRQGRLAAIRSKQTDDAGWQPPDVERMDITDRIAVVEDWNDRLNNIRIAQALNVQKDN